MKPAEAPLRVGVAGRGSDADPDLVELGRKLGRALADRGAVGLYRPTASTDPYVPALEHTVPQIMDSLRA